MLNGRVAIVTGAARGIGQAAAARLVIEGAHVIVADLDVAAAEQVAGTMKGAGRATPARVDVADRASVFTLVERVERETGAVDILVNNAGIAGRAAPLEEITDGDWEAMMAIDLKSVFLCCQAVIPGMKK